MRDNLFASVKQRLTSRFEKVEMKDGFVLTGRGHTHEASRYETVRNGRDTAAWYAAGRMVGLLSDDLAKEMLDAIETLQDTDPASPRFGCMRWYAEETKIDDTNGAFFVQMPLAAAMTVYPEAIPAEDKETILRILSRGGSWFREALDHGPIHYSNKILSDGGIALAIANLTGDAKLYEEGVAFFKRWIRYTREEGWGWGENMNVGYNLIIFTGMKLAIRSLHPGDQDVADELQAILDEQCEMFRFFNGHELTPAIRNYNYHGQEYLTSAVLNIAGIRGNGVRDLGADPWNFSSTVALFGDELYLDNDDYDARGLKNEQPVPRTRITHVFHENEGYSWVGENGSVGSLNNFPVYPNCYQHKGWGLGWQCMPVNAVVYGGQVSYARWVVEGDGWTRIHPKHCYLSPALFSEDDPYPPVRTRCRQKNNAVIAFRTMENLDNDGFAIWDEWYIPRCSAEIRTVEADGRTFTAVVYPNASILLSPLAGGEICRIDDENGVRLSVKRAASAEGHIKQEQLAGGFLIAFMDGSAEDGGLQRFADSIRVREEYALTPRFTDSVTFTVGDTTVEWDYDIAEKSTL